MRKKKTKIVATLTGSNCPVDYLQKLYDAGMDVVRINTAHETPDGARLLIHNIRQVSDAIAILLDTKGPEIRVTQGESDISLTQGQIISMYGDECGRSTQDKLYVTFDEMVNAIPVGATILIDDGLIELYVKDKDHERLFCEVISGGVITGRKSVNVPGVHTLLPALTQKDKDFIHFAIDNQVDFIAHSFVRSKEDVSAVQALLDERNSDIKIIAKIENQEGVDNIDSILDSVYGVMVARGDLGIEIPAEQIPEIQKDITKKCIVKKKAVIIATQMLHSMINHPRPTRAEVTDVASAVYDDADAVMLSGETAYGTYPLQAVETMSRIALHVESSKPGYNPASVDKECYEIPEFLAKSAVESSVHLNVKAIVCDTAYGSTVRNLSFLRARKPIYAIAYNKSTMRHLAINYGVQAYYMDQVQGTDAFIKKALILLMDKGKLGKEDEVAILAGNFGPTQSASFVEVSTVERLLNFLPN